MVGELLWLFYKHTRNVNLTSTAARSSFSRLIWKTFAQAFIRYAV